VSARQPSLRRLRDFGIRPRRELGQNFLIDSNILKVIGRAAELDPGDVVLEVGGGLGVLSEYLAPRIAHLHVVEVDGALRAPLEEALEPFANASLHQADAMKLDLAGLRPAPGKVVANLPYGIAASFLIRSVEELPTVERWVAMAQLEVAERMAAPPGSRTYGITSVIAQLCCHVRVLRRVGRGVFHPEPNVDSALLVLERHSPPPVPGLSALVHAAFAHRRKALAGSIALHGDPSLKTQAREALEALGLPADARAEQLSPADFAALHERLSAAFG